MMDGTCDWCDGTGWIVSDMFHWGPCPECLARGLCPRCGGPMDRSGGCSICEYDKEDAMREELARFDVDPFDYPDEFIRRDGVLQRR